MNINKSIKQGVKSPKWKSVNLNKTKEKKNNTRNNQNIKSNKINNKNNNKGNNKKSISEEKNVKKEEEKEKNKIQINLKDLNINDIISRNNKINITKNNSDLKGEKKIIFKMLSDKQNTVLNDLKLIKDNKNYINDISSKYLYSPKSLIENNINKDNLKQLNIKERELNDKLSSIKFELNNFTIEANKNNILKNKIKKLNNSKEEEKKIVNFISKLKKMGNEYKNINKKKEEYLKELEERELKEKEDSKYLKEREKEEFLSEKRFQEKSLILKRKQDMDEKIKNLMKTNNKFKKINLKKNYLYLQMENEYIENEKNMIKQVNEQKRMKVLPKDIKIIQKKMAEAKIKLEEKALKQKNELKKLWHSRSQILQKLKSPIFNEIPELEENKKIEKNKGNFAENKKEFIKSIKLPPISGILKKEMQKRLKKNITHSRNIINKKNNIVFHSDNNSISSDTKIYSGIQNKESNLSRNKLQTISVQTSSGRNIKNLKYIYYNINKNISRNPNDFNYLEEIRQKRISKNNEIEKNNNNIDNIFNSENNDINDLNLESKIKAMESKYKRNKQLLKLRGGYLKNEELGNNNNELLIDSIKNKLLIIEHS